MYVIIKSSWIDACGMPQDWKGVEMPAVLIQKSSHSSMGNCYRVTRPDGTKWVAFELRLESVTEEPKRQRLEIRHCNQANGRKSNPVYVAFDMLAAIDYFAVRYPGQEIDFEIDPEHKDCADCAVFSRFSMSLFVIEPENFKIDGGR